MPFGFQLQDGSSLVLQDGGSVLLLEQGAVVSASARPQDIRSDIRDRLVATGAFDQVYMSGPPTSDGVATAQIDPAKLGETHRIDADYDGMVLVHGFMDVHLGARDIDPDVVDRTIDRLFEVVCNAINGQSLAGITFPAFTQVTHDKWVAKGAVRRIATIEYQYITETWTSFNTDD